jgi:5'-nucleotidase
VNGARALVTNDDGIDSPGLLELAMVARDAGLDVVVAAPATEASGSSASITAVEREGRIVLERHALDGLEGVPAFAVQAAPALIVLIAMHEAFGTPPQLVLSGINRGTNVGRAIFHSGTVGAALTAGMNGARGLAVSMQVLPDTVEPDWKVAGTLAGGIISQLLDAPAQTVLNLNVPELEGDVVPEYRMATLAPFGIVQTTMTEQDRHLILLSVADPTGDPPAGSDAELLAAGFATLTVIESVREARVPALAEHFARAQNPAG